MKENKVYAGIWNDEKGGMNPTGNIVRDAWVFGILPEDEDCTGWAVAAIDALYDKVNAAWDVHGHLVSNLPEELRRRHARIYGEAMARARELGWDPELGEGD